MAPGRRRPEAAEELPSESPVLAAAPSFGPATSQQRGTWFGSFNPSSSSGFKNAQLLGGSGGMSSIKEGGEKQPKTAKARALQEKRGKKNNQFDTPMPEEAGTASSGALGGRRASQLSRVSLLGGELEEAEKLVPREKCWQSAARKDRNWSTCRKQFMEGAMPRAAAAVLSAQSKFCTNVLTNPQEWNGPPPDARIDDRTEMLKRHGAAHTAYVRNAHQKMQKQLLESMRNVFEEKEMTSLGIKEVDTAAVKMLKAEGMGLLSAFKEQKMKIDSEEQRLRSAFTKEGGGRFSPTSGRRSPSGASPRRSPSPKGSSTSPTNRKSGRSSSPTSPKSDRRSPSHRATSNAANQARIRSPKGTSPGDPKEPAPKIQVTGPSEAALPEAGTSQAKSRWKGASGATAGRQKVHF